MIVQNGLSRLPLAGNRPTDTAGYRLPLNDQLSAKAVVCQAVPGSVVSSEAPHRPTGIAAAYLSAFNGRPCEYHSASPLNHRYRPASQRRTASCRPACARGVGTGAGNGPGHPIYLASLAIRGEQALRRHCYGNR